MSAIFKFQLALEAQQRIEMPEGARILCVQVQRGIICLWAAVNPEAKKRMVTVRIYGTGHPIDADCGTYIGTVQQDGEFVWHVFAGPTRMTPV